MIHITLRIGYFVLLLILLTPGVNAQRKMDINRTFFYNSPEWVHTSASDSRQPPNTDSLICFLFIEESTGLENDLAMADRFILQQNTPNPFIFSTYIRSKLPKSEIVKLEVYNFLGQKIATQINKQIPAGSHQIEFNAQNLSSGIYFYKIQAGDFQEVKKALLVK